MTASSFLSPGETQAPLCYLIRAGLQLASIPQPLGKGTESNPTLCAMLVNGFGRSGTFSAPRGRHHGTWD